MELLVYKASAGSGKTFTLAVEYIKHLILNPYAYRQILAVTFTNKATTEMKERILQQLYGIWKGDSASDAYLEQISRQCPFPDEELRRRAGLAIQNMLHDYSRFRVETIDSFFQSVMRNLARELELSPNLNIELNNADVLDEAVDSFIEKLTPTSPALAWLLDYISERIADDKRWNVSDEVKIFGRNIFDEGYMEKGGNLRSKLQDASCIPSYKKSLHEMETAALEQMKGFSEQFEGILESHGLSPDDLKGGAKGIGSYFRKLRDGRISDKDVQNATLKNSLDDARNWASKTSKSRDVIIQLAGETLIPILQDAEKLRPSRNMAVNSARLSLQHLNKLQLLNHIDEEVRSLNREHNRFLLSDTNALLHQLVGEADSSFVFEKLGANIQNVMIDEFQDTSRMQWSNFRLLLLEGLSQGADSLIVGDVKQSIYRWRNGDWSILNNLGNPREHTMPENQFFTLNASLIKVKTLTTNRRSEARIILFNNQFFTEAVQYLNQKHLEELKEECLPLKEAYGDVAQESPKDTELGYIKASFIEADNSEDYMLQTLHALGNEVNRLLAEGVSQRDIAILVRKNKNIPQIADYFDKELQLTIVSDEAFRLDSSTAVLLLINALRCLANAEEQIAVYELQQMCNTLDETIEGLPAAFVQRRNELKLMPLYELLEELAVIFQLHRQSKQEAYLFSFFDAVTEYLQDHSSDLDSFILYWNETLCHKTIASGEVEGIRILSIHKSKGLEYHTILLPFCDWKMENETNNQLMWCSPKIEPFNQLDLLPITYSSSMAESVYREDYLQERLQLWVDNLNLLYVAFTRAEKNLIIWTRQNQKNTMSELLSNTLPQIAANHFGTWSEDESVFEFGDLCLSGKLQNQPKTSTLNKLQIQSEKLPIQLKSRRPDLDFRQSNRSADFISGISEEESKERFIERGKLLHTLFSAIETEKDIDNAIAQLVFEGIIESQEKENALREWTHDALSLPQVSDWYSGTWRLFNECTIIWMDNGVLCSRRPDRVMMRDKEIVVVDFKFGKPRKNYAKQVQEYMSLIRQMGYQEYHIQGFLWYVDEERIEVVDKFEYKN